MKPQIIGYDGISRDVRSVRNACAAIWKKNRKAVAIRYAESGRTDYASFNRKMHSNMLRAKNAPARYARRAARRSAEHAA